MYILKNIFSIKKLLIGIMRTKQVKTFLVAYTPGLQHMVIVFFIIVSIICTSASYISGYENKAHSNMGGWVRFNQNMLKSKNRYKTQLYKMGVSKAIKNHMGQVGFPDYLKISGHPRKLFFAYLRKGIIYEFYMTPEKQLIKNNNKYYHYKGLPAFILNEFKKYYGFSMAGNFRPPQPPGAYYPPNTHVKRPADFMDKRYDDRMKTRPSHKTYPVKYEKKDIVNKKNIVKHEDIVDHENDNSMTKNQEMGNRLALVIGNSNYTYGTSLENPVNDARAIKTNLESLGFTVIKYENCNQKNMKKAMDEFGEELEQYEVGLFFYAGHGIQSRGINYLIPVDINLESENEVEYDAVRADRVLAKMEDAGSKTNIVILDACRDNPFQRSWKRGSQDKGLAFMDAPSGSIIAYATSPGNTASDGTGDNGLYTSAILQHIQTPNITIEQMFKQVRSTIMESSDNKQIPWESTSLLGEFYFKKE